MVSPFQWLHTSPYIHKVGAGRVVKIDVSGPPGDEGDVEVLWHRASGRASTPPPGPPGDAYDPFQVHFSLPMYLELCDGDIKIIVTKFSAK